MDLETKILLNFLKSGYSTRQLDKLLNLHDSRGWASWKILKKYKLVNGDKQKLFLYSVQECKRIISELKKQGKKDLLKSLIVKNSPKKIRHIKTKNV